MPRSVSCCVLPLAVIGECASRSRCQRPQYTRSCTLRDYGAPAFRGVCRPSHGAGPPAAILEVPIFDIHARRRTHAGEGVDHQSDEGAIVQADDGRGVNAFEELASFICREHRRLAAPRRVLRTAAGRRWIHGHALAEHEVIKNQLALRSAGRVPLDVLLA